MTTKSEWTAYTGSDEQIAEMENAQYGVLLERDGEILDVSDMVWLWGYLDEQYINEYLICSPHPLAAMICQQAQTGQPVWMRTPNINKPGWFYHDQTSKVNWNMPNAEYSFTPFEGGL